MGFGIMLVGSCFMLLGAFTTFSPFTYVLGSAIVLYSLKELVLQNKAFIASAIASGVELLLSMTNMFLYVISSYGNALKYVSLATSAGVVLVSVIILIAIHLLAKEVDLPSVQIKVIITYVITAIYLIGLFLINFVFKDNEFVLTRLSVVCIFAQIIYSIMFIVVVANSYMRICYEDDKNMDKKASNGMLNFLNEKLNMAMTPREKRDIDKGDKKK